MRSILSAVVVFSTASFLCPGHQDPEPSDGAGVFRQYVDALAGIDSLSFESRYLWTVEGRVFGECTLRYFLEKPARYRVEVADPKGELSGLLVCDGRFCWTTWPQGTTLFSQYRDSQARESNIFRRERAYQGKSISHQLSVLPEVCMPVFNANVFFGGAESVMEYLEGVELVGEEEVDGEPCRVIKVDMMAGQRVRTMWLSKNDHLPRRLTEELLLSRSQRTTESWQSIDVTPLLEEDLFLWVIPEGFAERSLPTTEERILQVGDVAKSFRLKDRNGKILDLDDFEGQIIWLIFWRVG